MPMGRGTGWGKGAPRTECGHVGGKSRALRAPGCWKDHLGSFQLTITTEQPRQYLVCAEHSACARSVLLGPVHESRLAPGPSL